MRRIFAQILFAAPRVALNRTLSNAAHNSSLDGIYVSKKALKTTLALGAVLTGGLLYLRENADRKKVRLLLERSRLSLEKGDFEQFQKEREKAYVFLKQKLPEDKSVIALAMAIGASYEKTDEFAKALLFYSEALENVKLEKRILQCENLRILLLDRLGQCCKNIGNTDSAEKHFENAVKVYEQLKAELSLASESEYDTSALAKLDKSILNVLLHYVVLLVMLQRPDDASRARQRLTTIARASPQLRGQVAKIDCQVEDHIALEKIRMERKLMEAKGDEKNRSKTINTSWFSMWCEEALRVHLDMTTSVSVKYDTLREEIWNLNILTQPSISVRSYVKICILDQATTRGFDNLCVGKMYMATSLHHQNPSLSYLT
ncbi:putative tetratricopeptide-like helical domain superfamily [Plasmopara halstedii]